MIISDFIIGNNNNPVLMDSSVSPTTVEKTDLKLVRKNIPTKKLTLKKKIITPSSM
jgi:hypothetical protein